ncbi:RNA helicase [Dissulfurispira thermophila]|uniref:DEAD-box ATP-dependent RNA helicase RhpA n=2 Tax=root TaxID=1 RepID=A0A7G1H1V7_9BACT|nr:DEAD/DEAH box helicase [Dissulfurispira thermophila]BCB96133.1 RNA helicase [Dissulfurispira thermophila]
MKFEDFSLSKETLKAISEIGFEEPTPIQVSAIPLLLKGLDVVGQAQTGTGKTAAFGVPIVEKCQRGKNPFAIILEPTRELAVQVSQEINKIGKFKKINVLPVYGGTSIERQIKALKRGVDVIVGTPGRIIDHINRKTIFLSDVKIVVLDEADEMLNMGFIEDIETILRTTPQDRQTLLFSATMPQPIMSIAKKYMKNPEKIRVNTKDVVVPKIKQIFYEVREEDKINALSRLIDVEDPQLAIVFCHTKREVDDVSTKLVQMGYNAGALHGDYTQARREEIMKKFKEGRLDILVATDVAARGLDIQNVTHVINYSIPQNPDSYIHRIGRTGRAGKSGMAITFVTPREYRHLRLIEKTAKTVIDRKRLPSHADVIRAKEKNIAKDIEEIIRENKHTDYISAVRELSEQFSFGDIAAAALYAAYGEVKEMPVEESYEKVKTNDMPEAGIVRLFMTIGRRDKIKVPDIVKSIASEANIPYSKIGNIAVFDKFTFVEVPEELADRVIRSVDDMMMKGRRIKVQKAKART